MRCYIPQINPTVLWFSIHAFLETKASIKICHVVSFWAFPLRFVSSAPVGGAVTGRQTGAGGRVQCLGDTYYTSVDVAQFEPHDIVVMAYNHHVVIQAQKVGTQTSIGLLLDF